MRRQGIMLLAIIMVGSLIATASAADLKIGVVDLQKAMELSEAGQKAKAMFQKKVDRVQQDLNAAQEFYDHRLQAMATALRYTALGERLSQAVAKGEVSYLAPRLGAS